MKITKEQLQKLIKEVLKERNDCYGEVHETMAADRHITPHEFREPWDGIEENSNMISDNALKIEYLARTLGVEIPIDLTRSHGPKDRLEEDWTDDSGKRRRGPAPPGHWARQKEKESREAIRKGKKDPHKPDPRRG